MTRRKGRWDGNTKMDFRFTNVTTATLTVREKTYWNSCSQPLSILENTKRKRRQHESTRTDFSLTNATHDPQLVSWGRASACRRLTQTSLSLSTLEIRRGHQVTTAWSVHTTFFPYQGTRRQGHKEPFCGLLFFLLPPLPLFPRREGGPWEQAVRDQVVSKRWCITLGRKMVSLFLQTQGVVEWVIEGERVARQVLAHL